jgi:hypothetical protein
VVGAGEAAGVSEVSKLLVTVVDDDSEDAEEQALSDSEEAQDGTLQVDSIIDAVVALFHVYLIVLQGAFSKIVDAIRKVDEAGVDQVKYLVDELQRISLLWDELWLGTLSQHSYTVAKMVKRMEEEATRLELNEALSQEEKQKLSLEKYNIIFR